MNKLVTNISGGYPLTQEDLGFIQNNTEREIQFLLQLGDITLGNTILSGMRTGIIANMITSGAFVRLHEGIRQIYYIDATIVAGTYPTNYYIYYVPSFDAAGQKITRVGSTVQTYQLKKAGIGTIVPGDAEWSFPLSSAQRYEDRFSTWFKDKINSLNEWTSLSYQTGWDVKSFSGSAFDGLKYKITSDGTVHIRGNFHTTTHNIRNTTFNHNSANFDAATFPVIELPEAIIPSGNTYLNFIAPLDYSMPALSNYYFQAKAIVAFGKRTDNKWYMFLKPDFRDDSTGDNTDWGGFLNISYQL